MLKTKVSLIDYKTLHGWVLVSLVKSLLLGLYIPGALDFFYFFESVLLFPLYFLPLSVVSLFSCLFPLASFTSEFSHMLNLSATHYLTTELVTFLASGQLSVYFCRDIYCYTLYPLYAEHSHCIGCICLTGKLDRNANYWTAT